ncbi:MAG: deoxyribodipyrimidine photolyase [Vicinamibacteraceae bacterium]|nr:deoxyribodipyrimidine photolyase [Vicinamibacteraceae bacterium]
MPTPESRITPLTRHEANAAGRYVLYWMVSARRPGWNFGLDRAVELAARHEAPLLVFEALRCDYPWASDRLHAFILQGMDDNRRAFARAKVGYYPYVEPARGAARGLLAALAADAVVVVTDDFPAFFLRRMTMAAATRLGVPMERIDSNGLAPMAAADRAFPTALAFRAYLQRSLRGHLESFPSADPLAGAARFGTAEPPPGVLERWPAASDAVLSAAPSALAELPIDHAVAPVPATRGGYGAAHARWTGFLASGLARYVDERNQPGLEATSGLSPYLHFGHISAHQVFAELMSAERWTTRRVASRASGAREGWWGASAAAEAFLDQLVTWRELGFNLCHRREDYAEFDALPEWSRTTLERHASDARSHVYTIDELAAAATHDPLWNAAQRQLVREGRIHTYLRMLWGKKILEWTPHPRVALDAMIALNDRYALDGRDPNSYSGIGWVLGRFDRPWGPERPIFGTVRYMSSENTARKFRLADYLARYAA